MPPADGPRPRRRDRKAHVRVRIVELELELEGASDAALSALQRACSALLELGKPAADDDDGEPGGA